MTLLVAVALSGCGVELLGTTAVRGELEAQNAKSAIKQLDNVKGQAATINIEKAIKAYRADKGVNPPSLEDLVPDYLAKIPTKPDGSSYAYDPDTGKI